MDYGQAAFNHPIIKHTIDRVRKGQAEGALIKSSLSTLSFLVPSNQSHSQLPLLTLSDKWLILLACFHPAFSAACLLEGEVKSKTVAKKKNKVESQPGLPGSTEFRVDSLGRPGFTGPNP